MKRWLILTLGLSLAAAAAWVLLGERSPRGEPPMDRIDDASRARLERTLREAERGRE